MNKDFTPETMLLIYERQSGRCDRCGCDLNGCWPPANLHHKKRRSALTKADIEKHGPGGGSHNGVYLCGSCHEFVHHNTDEGKRWRTASWQEVGENEQATNQH